MPSAHLTVHERSVIEHLDRQGVSQAEIARQLKRHPGTISRELARNRPSPRCAYQARRAQAMTSQRRARANQRRAKLRHAPLQRWVRTKLRQRWSPRLIAGRCAHEHGGDRRMRISGMTIYRWLTQDQARGGTLCHSLPRRGKGRRPNGSCTSRTPRLGRRRIHDRPAGAANRTRFGHWELDTVEGAHKQAYLVSLVERKSRYTLLERAPDKRAETINACIRRMAERLDPALRRTVTSDNGREFDGYHELEQTLNLRFYFADPNSPWQRGTGEQTHGILRYFLPKGTDFRRISQARLARIESMLNNRPKVCLNYRTPAEAIPLPAVALRL